MQQPTEWMAKMIANAIQGKIAHRKEAHLLFSIDRYNYCGAISPAMRIRFMDDNNTFLYIELR